MSLTQSIKAEALRLGFHFAGVTTPDPPPHLPAFQKWLEAGRQGEMEYLATERSQQRRADPRQILPECRSILVLGVRYAAPGGPEEGEPGDSLTLHGRVAAYAWGEDYHEVLPGRLQSLVTFIENQAGHPIPNRWYTDTGPVLERDLAQRAGLGWIGKNTCLINPQMGSTFLLAEILLGIDLEPDEPFTSDQCGTCTRCLEVCPTSCILPDRTIDARRCISYLTIEQKGSIPDDLRPQMGNWVFGCDICQQVCPWNERFAPAEGDPAFTPRPGVPLPDLAVELSLTSEGFNRKFKGNPVKRAKRRGYLRNVAVALGNTAGKENLAAVSALARSLKSDSEPLVRAHAAWALGRIGGESARQALQEALDVEVDAGVREEIRKALDTDSADKHSAD